MKYIRTKYGIIKNELVKRYLLDQHYFLLVPESKRGIRKDKVKEYLEENTIKQSNNIESLCDEFILYYMSLDNQSDKEIFYPYAQYEKWSNTWQKDSENIKKKVIEGHHTLYGAIWTKKGLILVAKLNKKGKFELL